MILLVSQLRGRHKLQTITGRSVLIALVLTGLLGLVFLAVLSALGPDWGAYAPATCTATRCFCELPRTGMLLLQPANTWSSFGYVLSGCLMLVMPHERDTASALRRRFRPAARYPYARGQGLRCDRSRRRSAFLPIA